MNEFQIGDKVIGNKLADRYLITKQGWRGFVREIRKHENGELTLVVSENRYSGAEFNVYGYCFDVLSRACDIDEILEAIDVACVNCIVNTSADNRCCKTCPIRRVLCAVTTGGCYDD